MGERRRRAAAGAERSKSNMASSKPIGIVTGQAAPDRFAFVSEHDMVPPRLEYVVVRGARERVDDVPRTVDLLAQVTNTVADVLPLDSDVDFGEAQTVL